MVVFVIISQCVWSWRERRGEYEGSRVEGNGYPFRLSYFQCFKNQVGGQCVYISLLTYAWMLMGIRDGKLPISPKAY